MIDEHTQMWQSIAMDDRRDECNRIRDALTEIIEALRIQIRRLGWISRELTEIDETRKCPELERVMSLLIRAEQVVRGLDVD